jgi:hypothetical protein
VGNTARVAKEANVRFILVSALAVDRPASKSFRITNMLGGYADSIMDAKPRGEEKVRATLKDYVIVWPGVLMGGGQPLRRWRGTQPGGLLKGRAEPG